MAKGNFTVCIAPTESETSYYVTVIAPDGMTTGAQRETRAQCWKLVEDVMDRWNDRHKPVPGEQECSFCSGPYGCQCHTR